MPIATERRTWSVETVKPYPAEDNTVPGTTTTYVSNDGKTMTVVRPAQETNPYDPRTAPRVEGVPSM